MKGGRFTLSTKVDRGEKLDGIREQTGRILVQTENDPYLRIPDTRMFLSLRHRPQHQETHPATRHGSTGLQPGEPSLNIKGL